MAHTCIKSSEIIELLKIVTVGRWINVKEQIELGTMSWFFFLTKKAFQKFPRNSYVFWMQCKNDDFSGLFSEYGLTYKFLNNFDLVENQN